MNTFLIFLHVAAAIILIGPVMVATSAFPKAATQANTGDAQAIGRAALLPVSYTHLTLPTKA